MFLIISVKGMDTFNLEILFSEVKAEIFSTSLTGTSFFLAFSLYTVSRFDFSADGDLLILGSTVSFPFFCARGESFFGAEASFLF